MTVPFAMTEALKTADNVSPAAHVLCGIDSEYMSVAFRSSYSSDCWNSKESAGKDRISCTGAVEHRFERRLWPQTAMARRVYRTEISLNAGASDVDAGRIPPTMTSKGNVCVPGIIGDAELSSCHSSLQISYAVSGLESKMSKTVCCDGKLPTFRVPMA